MPSVDEVELGADLVADTLGRTLGVEDIFECLAGIQPPVGLDVVVIEVEDGAQIVVEDDVDV